MMIIAACINGIKVSTELPGVNRRLIQYFKFENPTSIETSLEKTMNKYQDHFIDVMLGEYKQLKQSGVDANF